jgi:hypothetical protein
MSPDVGTGIHILLLNSLVARTDTAPLSAGLLYSDLLDARFAQLEGGKTGVSAREIARLKQHLILSRWTGLSRSFL